MTSPASRRRCPTCAPCSAASTGAPRSHRTFPACACMTDTIARNPDRMNLLRRAAELIMSVAVLVVFAGLLTVPEAEQGDAERPHARGGAGRFTLARRPRSSCRRTPSGRPAWTVSQNEGHRMTTDERPPAPEGAGPIRRSRPTCAPARSARRCAGWSSRPAATGSPRSAATATTCGARATCAPRGLAREPAPRPGPAARPDGPRRRRVA